MWEDWFTSLSVHCDHTDAVQMKELDSNRHVLPRLYCVFPRGKPILWETMENPYWFPHFGDQENNGFSMDFPYPRDNELHGKYM